MKIVPPPARDLSTSASAARESIEQQRIPFLDLRPSHELLRNEIVADFGELIDSSQFVNGPQVEAFEQDFAEYCGVSECVGVSSGLDALRLALVALGVAAEEEVLVPALTFVATVEAVLQAGARPVLVDISDADYCLDVAAAADAITSRTRFLLPVHLYGQLADMRRVSELAVSRDLVVVEDACQAHGAERDWYRSGSCSAAGCFSFYPSKNLGAMGDAGAVTTSDGELAARVRALREHGQLVRHEHRLVGYTARLDSVQAMVLRNKLTLLERWNGQRAAAASYYMDHLYGLGDLGLPPVAEGSRPVWHLFVITTADPEGLGEHLAAAGVESARHYRRPVHLNPAFEGLGRQGEFPVAERLARSALSLPLYPGIEEWQLARTVAALRAYFDGK
jgi:dTDP-4-amino-4,6-dideoxygalactose transaminase